MFSTHMKAFPALKRRETGNQMRLFARRPDTKAYIAKRRALRCWKEETARAWKYGKFTNRHHPHLEEACWQLQSFPLRIGRGGLGQR